MPRRTHAAQSIRRESIRHQSIRSRSIRSVTIALAAALLATAGVALPAHADTTAAGAQPAGATISGTVIRAVTKLPVAHLGVELLGAGDVHLQSATTGAAGRYAFHGLAAGTYKVHFAAAVRTASVKAVSRRYLQSWTTTTVAADRTRHVDDTITLGGVFIGQVIGADGTPIAHATLSAVGRDNVKHTATANAQGRYTLRGFATGRYSIFVWDPSHRWGGVTVTGSAVADTVRAVDVRAHTRGATISGHVDEGATAVSAKGGSVTAVAGHGEWYVAPISSTGDYTVRGLGRGVYHLTFTTYGAYARTTVRGVRVVPSALATDERTGVDANLTKWGAAVTGTVVDAVTGAAFGNVGVSVYTAAGVKIAFQMTDTDGTFGLGAQLPSGDYTVVFGDFSGTHATLTDTGVHLTRGQDVTLNAPMVPTA